MILHIKLNKLVYTHVYVKIVSVSQADLLLL